MSSIGKYSNDLLGFIKCETDFNLVFGNNTKLIPVYLLLENVPNSESDFDGMKGDVLLGGGSGEAPAFRISMQKCMKYFFDETWDEWLGRDELYKSFWNSTQSYIIGHGFRKNGWTPEIQLEEWLARNVCLALHSKNSIWCDGKISETTSLDFYDEYSEQPSSHNFQYVWVFNGEDTNFPCAVFESCQSAEKWASENGITGTITEYPVGISVYDWTVLKGHFRPSQKQKSPKYISRYSSAYLRHKHISTEKIERE